jgi:GNAT superfamily N-acetyltransferase
MHAAGLTIREAAPGDARGIAQLLAELGYPVSPAVVAERLARLAASPADLALVAADGADVVGLAGVHVFTSLEQGEVGKLNELVVAQSRRRRGIGAALIAAIEAEARRRGCVLLFLTTAERRKDAHRFYRALGFEETGRRFAKPLG